MRDDVVEALTALSGRVETLGGALGGRIDALGVEIVGRIAAVAVRMDTLAARMDTLRINIMDRIDRVQDVTTRTQHDMQALLELMAVNQRYAETGVHAMQSVGELSTVVTRLVQDVRRLDAAIQELRGK